MKPGMLADVQAVQVEAEGFGLDEKRIDQRLRDAAACVLYQALAHQAKIANELFCFGVTPLPARILQRTLDPLLNIKKKEAIAFSLRIGQRIAMDRGEHFSVFLQRSLEFRGNRRYSG